MNKGNFPLFSAWLKHFTLTVFLQSFHAIFLMFSMVMLSQLQGHTGNASNDGVLAVVAIACAMALIKFEKMVKKILGIEDSPIGTTSSAGAKMFMGAKSAIDLGKTATSGFKKSRDANKNLSDIQKKKAKKQEAYDRLFGADGGGVGGGGAGKSAQSQRAEELLNNERNRANAAAAGSATSGNTYGGNDFHKELERQRRQEELDDLEAQEIKAAKAKRTEGLDKYLNAAGTLASLSIGLGAADELSESLTIANVINRPIAGATTMYADARAGRETYEEYRNKYKTANDKIDAENEQRVANGQEKIAYKYADDKGNRNEVDRASKVLEQSLISGLKEGLKDFHSEAGRMAPTKLAVDTVVKYEINKEVKTGIETKRLNNIREKQKNTSVDDL